MYFDGASAQNSTGSGVMLISPSKENIHLSYKIDFKTKNNVAEYEALLLGVKVTKEMGIMCVNIFGDADIIIHQVNNTFQMKNIRLKAYREEVWKLRDSFMFFELSYIPRDLNHLADSLAISASLFVPPSPPKLSYDIQVKYKPSLPDNVKFWRVFENDGELSKFLQLVDEFYDIHIDQKHLNLEESKQLKLKDKVTEHNIVQLPSNYIP